MDPHLGGFTRRAWLGLAATGLGVGPWALVARGSQDGKNAARKPRIIAHAVNLGGRREITGFIGVDPDDGTWQLLASTKRQATHGRVSPDGKTLAYVEYADRKPGLWTFGLGGDEPPRKIGDRGGELVWSPDGKHLIVSSPKDGPEPNRFETRRIDADGSHPTKLPVPEDQTILDGSPDGKWLLTATAGAPDQAKRTISLVRIDGAERRAFYDGPDYFFVGRFSPDGRELVYATHKWITRDDRLVRRGIDHWIARVDGTGRRRLPLEDNVSALPCWSPDGKRLALAVVDYERDENGDLSSLGQKRNVRIEVMDADGKTRRNLDLPDVPLLKLCDWR